jgi:predicted nucleotidyltransferase
MLMSEPLLETLKKSVATLDAARVPYLLGGGVGCWVRGGPQSTNDVDLMVQRGDAERALRALAEAGMRPEDPPEQWLLKAWDGDVLVDVIFAPIGLELTDEVMARGEDLDFGGMRVRAMALEDILTTKLMAIDEHNLDYGQLLQIARALREQIDWRALWERTSSHPYAKAFLVLAEELGIAPGRLDAVPGSPRVRLAADG